MKKRLLLCFVLLLVGLLTGGCSYIDTYITKPAIRSEYDKNVKDYNRMLRWKEMESAIALYAILELKKEFEESVAAAKKKDVTITDYRILATDYNIEKETAEAKVEYEYYILPSNRIKKLIYKQEWVHATIGLDQKAWKLKSVLPVFE